MSILTNGYVPAENIPSTTKEEQVACEARLRALKEENVDYVAVVETPIPPRTVQILRKP